MDPTPPSGPTPPRPPVLTGLGISPADERVYRAFLAAPGSTPEQLATATGLTEQRVRRHVRSLARLGLLTEAADGPERYTPAPPDVALEVLALRRQEEIAHARLAAAGLAEEFRAGRLRGGGSPVQVLRGREAIAQQFFQTQQTAKNEILILDKPPYVVEPLRRQDTVQLERLDKGVRYRAVYDQAGLDGPGRAEATRDLAARGEESRVLADVPLKLVIADHRVALVPFVVASQEEILVVQQSALLDGLIALFELLWQRATPLWPAAPGAHELLSPEDELLLGHLRAGLTDSAIARRLGVAQRTVERRMSRIMAVLGVRTRFQAGVRTTTLYGPGDGEPPGVTRGR
ncbi:winged helix-turn-helix transcriptional regulator [Streptomyces sp. p1417]|uniref:Winged helix-turn-helix transcriptional regulator n=1 Tax=Streptomyces typhae TaxID=2681492 RepID=A0A6L6X3D8_9ACTN|nr:LuxR family transcriptional regulator [Streptomyces typhae]MVO88302.1 winged helix-turn-helix transcriptional regulator [Streptomyces typhae]